ncbi:hypothetical protein LCGC14_2160480, partial [marine sediment metagenome]
YLFQVKKIWLKNIEKISLNMKYDSFLLREILKDLYFNFEFFFEPVNIVFNFLQNFIQFIKHIHPLIVIIPNDLVPEGRIFSEWCRNKKIPSLYIPHAMRPIYEEIITKPNVEFYTVSGTQDKEYFKSQGISQEKILVTGRSIYEKIHQGKIKRLSDARDMFNQRTYKFEPERFTILLTTNPIDDISNEKLINTVINSLKELNLIDNLIIKLHPGENGILHRKVLNKLNSYPIIIQDCKILELINSCDLLLSRKSTTILEAMILGTPIVLLDFINLDFSFSNKYQFLEEESLIKLNNEKELTKTIRKIISSNAYLKKYSEDLKEIAKKYCFYDKKERTTVKIGNFIKEIIKNKKFKEE